MHIFRNYLRNKYHISNYQISQIFFLFKTLASEMSKIIIMGFLFSNQLSHYIYALFIMLFLRCTTGGLHFYTYTQCLIASIFYLWSAFLLANHIQPTQYMHLLLLLLSIVLCYIIGSIPSKYRPVPSPVFLKRNKCIISSCIFIYSLYLYTIPKTIVPSR